MWSYTSVPHIRIFTAWCSIKHRIGAPNTEALVVASEGVGLEVNAEETKYMVMSGDQNAGQNYNIRADNKSFGRVEDFKYLGKKH